MTLLFDLVPTQTELVGVNGGGEYTRSVLRQLAVVAGPGLAGFYDSRAPLDADIASLVADRGMALHQVGAPGDLQKLVGTGDFDAIMSGVPYQLHGVDYSGMHVYWTVHGLRPLEVRTPFWGRHYEQTAAGYLKWAVRYGWELVRGDWRRQQFEDLVNVPAAGRTVIVPSWHTRYSLREKVCLPADLEVRSFYSPETAVCCITDPSLELLDRLGVEPGRYLLMVSGNRWIKNSYPALQAYLAVMAGLPVARRLPMVVTGGIPRGLPRRGRDQIRCPGDIDLADLAALYKGARAFIYPTLNEGFGYPPLEAWAQGTPVLASAVSSVTEILGDAAIYFSPTSTDEMKIRIRLAAEDDDLLAEMTDKGRRRLAVVREKQRADLAELCQMLARWTH